MQPLTATLTLDRRTYLSGEQIVATIVVTNPADRPITALPPFRSPLTSLSVATLNKQGEWETVGGDLGISGDSSAALSQGKPVTIGPGDRLTQTVILTDPTDLGSESIRHNPITVLTPGSYRVRFTYERPAQAEFQVLAIEPKGAATAKALKDAEQFRSKKWPAAKGCAGMWAASLRAEGKVYVVVSASGTVDVCKFRDPDQRTLLNLLCPFVRVAEAPNGVAGITLEPAADGVVNLAWEDLQGSSQRVVLARRQYYDLSKAH
jgi:hypothetical protein